MCFVLGCAAAATPNTYCTHARKEGVNWRIGYTNENPLRSNTERKTHKQHLRLIIHNLPSQQLVLWKTRENECICFQGRHRYVMRRLRITFLMHLENTACLEEEATTKYTFWSNLEVPYWLFPFTMLRDSPDSTCLPEEGSRLLIPTVWRLSGTLSS